MRVSVARTALAAAGLAAVGLVGSASAAVQPASKPSTLSFSDPAGDALGTQKPYDITQVGFTTKGVTTKVGKKTTYKPKSLVVTMTIAGDFASTAGASYEVDVDVAGCGYANFTYTPGSSLSDGGLFTECGSPTDQTGSTSTLYNQPPTVKGSTVTWDFPLSGLSEEFKAGAVISAITAHTVQNDPVFGIIGPGAFASEGNFDNASTDKTFTI